MPLPWLLSRYCLSVKLLDASCVFRPNLRLSLWWLDCYYTVAMMLTRHLLYCLHAAYSDCIILHCTTLHCTALCDCIALRSCQCSAQCYGALPTQQHALHYTSFLHITSSHPIASHHNTPHHIISYHIISYHIISYHIISYHIISYHIISYHIICACSSW